MAVFTSYLNNTPLLTTDSGSSQGYSGVAFLDVNPAHTNLAKHLYLIVGLAHTLRVRYVVKLYKRGKHNSDAVVFHTTEGGAAPTTTHQIKARGIYGRG